MNVIALLTDFGLKDHFLGVIKGVILRINPQAKLVDISHNILPHNIREAAFILCGSFSYFPKGTVFLTVVDPGVGSARHPIAIKTKNYYFVGPDNGVLSIAAQRDGIEKIIALENRRYFLKNISSTFHARDIFAPIAAHISKGADILSLGPSSRGIEEINLPPPKISGNTLNAEVIYADKFGNLITNMTKKQFLDFTKGKDFSAILKNKRIKKLYSFYAQAKDNEPFLIEGSLSLLEISLKNKSAKDYFFVKNINAIKINIKRFL